MSRTWKQKYYDEVERMTLICEQINQRAETIVRKPTAEELEYYYSVINTPKETYLSKYMKGKMK